MKGKIAFVVIKIPESKNRKALILISLFYSCKTPLNPSKSRERNYLLLKYQRSFANVQRLFKITPVDVKYKVLATACK